MHLTYRVGNDALHWTMIPHMKDPDSYLVVSSSAFPTISNNTRWRNLEYQFRKMPTSNVERVEKAGKGESSWEGSRYNALIHWLFHSYYTDNYSIPVTVQKIRLNNFSSKVGSKQKNNRMWCWISTDLNMQYNVCSLNTYGKLKIKTTWSYQ